MEIEKGYEFNEQKKYKGGLKYYMLPWLNNNVGILETTIKNSETPEPLDWMKKSAKEYINLSEDKSVLSSYKYLNGDNDG